jgi:hypothetical protein
MINFWVAYHPENRASKTFPTYPTDPSRLAYLAGCFSHTVVAPVRGLPDISVMR